MVAPIVLLLLLVIAGTVHGLRVAKRRREARTMFVCTYPDIELQQRYGGWDADAYDSHAGRDHAPAVRPSTRAYTEGTVMRPVRRR